MQDAGGGGVSNPYKLKNLMPKAFSKMSDAEKEEYFKQMAANYTNFGEALDSIIGAPARLGLDELVQRKGSLGTLAKPFPQELEDIRSGNFDGGTIGHMLSQMGKDPRTAPTGYDIASKVTDNPYLGTYLATAADLTQLPIGLGLPGVVGEVRGVKSAGKIADATEAFAERGKAAPSTETKIAQMNGQTGEVRDAMPQLLGRAEGDWNAAQRKGKQMSEMGGEKSAYDNPRNAPARAEESSGNWMLDEVNKKWAEHEAKHGPEPESRYHISDNYSVDKENPSFIQADVFKGAKAKPFENDHLERLEARGFSKDEIQAAQDPESNSTAINPGGKQPFPIPNYKAKVTGVIGEPRIQGYSKTEADPFAWAQDKWGATKQLLERHKEAGIAPTINTSSDLIAKDDYIDALPKGSTINLHYGLDFGHRTNLLPGNPSNERLDKAAERLEQAGFKVNRIMPTIEDVLDAHNKIYEQGSKLKFGEDLPKEELVKRLKEVGLLTNAERDAGAIPFRKPDSLNAATPAAMPGAGLAAAASSAQQGAQERQAKDGTFYRQVGADSWTPVTRTAKDGTVYKKVGADAWTPVSGGAPAEPKGESQAQTALEGFGNGAAMGYLPQLQALAAKPIYAVLNQSQGGSPYGPEADSYTEERDRNVQRQARQMRDNPYTAGAANVAGAVTSGLAMGPLMPARAATVGGRIAQGAKIGAVMGALSNPGDDAQGQIQPLQPVDRLLNAGKGYLAGGALSSLLESPQLAKAGINKVQKFLSDRVGQNVAYTPVENAGAIQDAAQTLGVKDVPKALLTDNPTFQKLESGLSQSGSLPAKSIRDQYTNFFKTLEDASKKISDLKTPESEFSLGKQIASRAEKQVSDARTPISEMYDALTPHLKKIEVNPDVTTKVFASLKRNKLFQTVDGKAMLAEYQNILQDNPMDLASLKEFRSTIGESASKTASELDIKRLDAIKNAVTSIRDNTINALKEHMPADTHGEVDALIGDMALADAAHASHLKDINSVKSLVGNKPINSPGSFLRKLSEMKEADIANRASNLDVGTMRALKDTYPSVFEKVKTARLNDMVRNAESPVSGFSDTKFLRGYDSLDQEMKDLIFDPKMQSHIEALKTLKQAIPEKLGPSGTPEGQMMMDMFNPKRNALDYGVKKTLEATSGRVKAPSEFSDVLPQHSPAKTALQLILSRPSVENQIAQPRAMPMQKAADNKQPSKGPDKWANDGLKALQSHASDQTEKDALEKLGQSKIDQTTKELLIRASDLKPGTKAMEKIMEKVRERMKSKVIAGDDD